MTRLLVVLAIAAAVGTLFVFGLRPRDARDVASPFVGKTLDDWTAPTLERYRFEYGDTLNFAQLAAQGEPLVINFWASWCKPACWNEAPRWKAAWERYGDRVSIVGINFQDEAQDAETFLERFNKPFPSVSDPRGKIGVVWGVFGVPETYFINADGTLNFKQNGEVSMATIDTQIRALLENAGGSASLK